MSADLYAETTARIIEALEQGTPPWVRPWSTIPDALPMNAQSRRPYRGINFTLLSLAAEHHGYAVNRWLTFPQPSELGANVRKGEQGTPVVFWRLRRIGVVADAFPEPDDDPPTMRGKVFPLLRSFTVFNVAQTEGLDPRYTEPSMPTWVPEAKAEELLLMSGARFRTGGASSVLPARQRRDSLATPRGVRHCGGLLQHRTTRVGALVGALNPMQSRPNWTFWRFVIRP